MQTLLTLALVVACGAWLARRFYRLWQHRVENHCAGCSHAHRPNHPMLRIVPPPAGRGSQEPGSPKAGPKGFSSGNGG